MKQFFKTLMAAVLALSLVVPMGVTGTTALAAGKKAQLNVTSMTIPVGKQTAKTYWHANKAGTFNDGKRTLAKKLTVKNKVKGATYTFSSSDKKIVTIDKTGGYPTGVKAGTAYITCTQKLNGKSTVVGKCKVKVAKATLSESVEDFAYTIGECVLATPYMDTLMINYRNPDATYTYECNSDNIKITEEKVTGENIHNYVGYEDTNYVMVQKLSAKEAGTYKITVKETYKKKTRSLGTFEIVIQPETAVDYELPVNSYIDNSYLASVLVSYAANDAKYNFEIVSGEDVVTFEDGNLVALKTGTAKISVTNTNSGKEIGTSTITVVEIPCETVSISETGATYVGSTEVDGLSYIDLEPYNTTDSLVITSSDSTILEVTVDEDGEYGFLAKSEGVATITVECGNVTASCEVTVYADEDDYYENY